MEKKKWGNPLVAFRLARADEAKLRRHAELLGVRPSDLARALCLAGISEAKYDTVSRFLVFPQLELPFDGAQRDEQPAKKGLKPAGRRK